MFQGLVSFVRFRQLNQGSGWINIIMEDHEKVYLVVSGVISWTSAFLLTRKVFPKRSFDFSNRIVSTIHAVFAVVLSSLSVQDWRCPVCPLAANSSPLQVRKKKRSHLFRVFFIFARNLEFIAVLS